MTMIHIGIPNWLDRFFTFPLLVFRLLRYGYTFRRIYLGEGEWTILDEEDYYKYGRYKWILGGREKKFYAVGSIKDNKGEVKIVNLHRLIMNSPDGFLVDHKNGDGLDNRRANLRIATRRQNCCNRKKIRLKTTSKYIGVHFEKSRGRWSASIRHNGKTLWLGRFGSEIEAAKAYDAAAKKYHGDFARLNNV
ncbi:MAG: AP2 domain-containing protein [Sedimentisphaerales bacterium]